jgi:hypothetical protein
VGIIGRGRVAREGEGGGICSRYFVYMYENREVKSVEVDLRRMGAGTRKNDGRNESN